MILYEVNVQRLSAYVGCGFCVRWIWLLRTLDTDLRTLDTDLRTLGTDFVYVIRILRLYRYLVFTLLVLIIAILSRWSNINVHYAIW